MNKLEPIAIPKIKITAKVEKTFDTKTFGDTGSYRVKELVLMFKNDNYYDGNIYNQFLKVSVFGRILKNFEESNIASGDIVNAEIEISGRVYERNGDTSYFNQLSVKSINLVSKLTEQPSTTTTDLSAYGLDNSDAPKESNLQDLPF